MNTRSPRQPRWPSKPHVRRGPWAHTVWECGSVSYTGNGIPLETVGYGATKLQAWQRWQDAETSRRRAEKAALFEQCRV